MYSSLLTCSHGREKHFHHSPLFENHLIPNGLRFENWKSIFLTLALVLFNQYPQNNNAKTALE